MMKIKMKVKHLIWGVLGLVFFVFIIVPFGNNQIAYKLRHSKPDISKKLYKANLKYPTRFFKDESLYKLAENIIGGYGRYNINKSGRGGSSLVLQEDMDLVIGNYKKILEKYPKSKYYEEAYQGILDAHIYSGDSKGLREWIEWGSLKENEDINKLSDLYRAYNYFVNREYDRAEEIIEDYSLGNKDIDYIYYFLRGHIDFMREDFDRALEYYELASDLGWEHEKSFFGNFPPDMREQWLRTLRYKGGDNRIRGRVTIDGIGVPFAEIYLQNPRYGWGSRGGNFIAITDEEGYYETIGIQDGRYEIGIEIAMPMIFDKVYKEKNMERLVLSEDMEYNFEFIDPIKVRRPGKNQKVKGESFTVEWEEIPGADYYTVHTIGYEDPFSNQGSSITFPIYDENGEKDIKETRAVFNIEDLNNQGSGLMFTEVEGEFKVTPQGILGYFDPGSNMTILVNGYDQEGNLLASSLPLVSYSDELPSIRVPDQDLSPGERLILDNKYEEAMEHYEEILEEDEENVEALKYLYRIYSYNYEDDEKRREKGLEYGRRLYEIIGSEYLLRILDDLEYR